MSSLYPILNLDAAPPGRKLPRKTYSYGDDSMLNRYLGEPVDADWAGFV